MQKIIVTIRAVKWKQDPPEKGEGRDCLLFQKWDCHNCWDIYPTMREDGQGL